MSVFTALKTKASFLIHFPSQAKRSKVKKNTKGKEVRYKSKDIREPKKERKKKKKKNHPRRKEMAEEVLPLLRIWGAVLCAPASLSARSVAPVAVCG